MKNISIALFLVQALLFSCNKQREETELTGTWKLNEVLIDPGDGSGSFASVPNNKQIEFHSDGTITSNGVLCSLDILADNPSSGTYSVMDSSITSQHCNNTTKIRFRKEGSTLILIYTCIEPCRFKYIKK